MMTKCLARFSRWYLDERSFGKWLVGKRGKRGLLALPSCHGRDQKSSNLGNVGALNETKVARRWSMVEACGTNVKDSTRRDSSRCSSRAVSGQSDFKLGSGFKKRSKTLSKVGQ